MTYNANVRANPFTENIGRDVKSFQNKQMFKIDHEDPNIHLIGESLGAPSLDEMRPTGVSPYTGDSPFVARADHVHDSQNMWMLVGQSGAGAKSCPPGGTFLNNLQIYNGGVDWPALSGGQIISLPREGFYILYVNFETTRPAGFDADEQANLRGYYYNGTASRLCWRDPDTIGASAGVRLINFVDVIGDPTPGSSFNIQYAYEHNDSVNHLVQVNYILVMRTGNYNYVP